MKKLILLLSAILISITFSFSQSPQAFKYQTVVRDAAGEILDGQTVSFRIAIRDATAIGTILYQETHTSTTNQFGLATFEIGNGTPEPGSGLFADIDWEINSKYLEIELDPDGGTAYSLMGTSKILSTPYAMYADTAGYSEDTDWILTGDDMYANIPGNVGIGTQNPISPLHVQGRGAFGNAVNSTKANRALNLISTDAVMRVWRATDVTSFDPAVELIWGTQPTQGDDGNYWWDFFLKSSDGSFNIRDRSFDQGHAIRLAIDTLGRIGIGTTSPEEKLHLVGSMIIEDMVSGSLSDSLVLWDPIDSKLKVTSLTGLSGDNDWTIDADTLYSAVDSTVTIKDGKVGIGTTNPDGQFVIMDGADTLFKIVDGQVRIGGNGPTQGIAFMGDAKSGINGDPTNISNGLFRPAPNTQALATGNQERLRITSTGDIGIGTLTPQERLDVNGGIRIGFSNNNNAGTIRWTGTQMEFNDGIQWNPFETVSSPPQWAEDGSNIYNINPGFVGIGTPMPTHTLDVMGEARIEIMNPNNMLDNVVVADELGVLHIRDAASLGGFSKNIKDVLRLEPRNTYPANPEEGDIFVNAKNHNIYCYLNGEWKQLNN